jgi:putative nucleotidyltransferase with HDIG domain
MESIPPRDAALALLQRYNSNPSLINHAKSVEATMRFMARKKGADEELWGRVGLIHDLDYEKFPENHCHETAKLLRADNWPEEMVRAVLSHGWQICTEVEPRSELEKTLYAVDELAGLVTACALVRPSKSVGDLSVKSVKKKWKQKSFAAGADREVILRGAEMMGVELDELIGDVIAALREVADEIGL